MRFNLRELETKMANFILSLRGLSEFVPNSKAIVPNSRQLVLELRSRSYCVSPSTTGGIMCKPECYTCTPVPISGRR